MANNHQTLFSLADGESTSNAFPLFILNTVTIGELNLIKMEMAPHTDDIAADELTLWCISIPGNDDNHLLILLDSVPEKKRLKVTPSSPKSLILSCWRTLFTFLCSDPLQVMQHALLSLMHCFDCPLCCTNQVYSFNCTNIVHSLSLPVFPLLSLLTFRSIPSWQAAIW